MEVMRLDKINKEFDNNKVIDDISFSIQKGEMIAIVGESGRGKTTLLNIIGLISKPSSGDLYLFDKKNVDIYSKDAMLLRRNKIGYLFQNYGLVEDETVKWNLNIVLEYKKLSKRERNNKIEEALKMLKLESLKDKPVYKLSGGEQQRIAMLKLYLQECELVLADEPTGSLDERNRAVIIQMLKDFNKQGKTIIIVTHDSYVANCCDRIIKL
ncbi:putative bacteriocin export ABC transporter [Clostridium manihotivorum]|uniref:Bacteriocin ABC transporter ATP-binding protein n=1 Tax=Clostridium manihotivorum TaxID=2320868 RepID=A0A410DT34_9CLOT|nr:putative bacteriocin export ABC transporter [Clostridium manihotivorum]QAA32239.1 bacteriocin ABC transporter ATP-binding protein [Clostridium manihotivorum]